MDGDCLFANLRRACGDSFHALQCLGVSGVEIKIYERSLQALLSLPAHRSLVFPRVHSFMYFPPSGVLASKLLRDAIRAGLGKQANRGPIQYIIIGA